MNETKNILYHICFDNRDSLPGDDDAAADDNDTSDMSTCDMQPTDDEVAEIFRKQVILYNNVMSHVFPEM